MKVIFGFDKVKRLNKPVVALGVFDGVHRGHIRILKNAARKAYAIGGKSVVVTFWPHPQKEESLYSLEHRIKQIASIGIDICIVVNFSSSFSKISAKDFIKDYLFKKIHPCYVYVGRNFRFGKNAAGDFRILKELAKAYGFKLRIFNVVKIRRRPISSTYIRYLIKNGKLSYAQSLLGKPVTVFGTVIKGISLGRKLGFPTANIDPHHEVIPPVGVYAVRIMYDSKRLDGVCNIGVKPTFFFNKTSNPDVELHIINFRDNLYRKDLEIQFIKKIRNEKKFSSPGVFKEQIKKDIKLAKSILSHH